MSRSIEKLQIKEHISVNVAGPQSETLSKNKPRYKYFQLNCLSFKNTCFKENSREKSNNFEMQCIVFQSRCIVLHFQLLKLVRLTDRWSTFYETRMNRLMEQHLVSSATNKKGKGNMNSTMWKYTVESMVHSI